MASRHLSRSVALQTLYEWDFRGSHSDQLEGIMAHNIAEFGTGLDDATFIETLTRGTVEHLAEIDGIIVRAAPQWPLDQIASVDRAVLRIGLFELLFGNRSEVPPKVAINEAIELAKSFGGESSSRFVNGVLGTIYREIGEPGKHDAPPREIEATPEATPVESESTETETV